MKWTTRADFFPNGALGKATYCFADTERGTLKYAKYGETVSVKAIDGKDEPIEIRFVVVRSQPLGKTWKIEGFVLSLQDGVYRKVVITLHDEEPEADTFEEFSEAPPVGFKMPRQ